MELGIVSYGAITIIAYLIGFIWKTTDKLPDKWIPAICGTTGCILGIISFLLKVPEFPADDIITAAAVGVVSGFAATGIHQVYKQLMKPASDGFVELPKLENIDFKEDTESEEETDSTK